MRCRLPLPEAVLRHRIDWTNTLVVASFHLLALLALVPAFFSWSGVILCVAGIYVFGTLGINLCYHRLLTHRGFKCSPRVEHTLAIIGLCCYQDTPARWVAAHRQHHEHADRQPDPHTPLVSFFWSHVGWLLVENRDLSQLSNWERYVRDILRDPFYKALERNNRQAKILLASAALFFLAGFVPVLATGGTLSDAATLGASLLIWGVFVRTVIVWHITWSVNSVTHLWGYRNYATDEGSRNNLLIGFLSNGEGWHNNHHADQRSARHGHRWWELDVTYLTLRAMVALGLARDIAMPISQRVAQRQANPPQQ